MKEFISSTPFRQYTGFRLSLEEKFFYADLMGRQDYISAELNFLSVNYTTETLFRKGSSFSFADYVDTFGVNKKTYSFNIRRGHQFYFGRLVFDASMGLGVKYKELGWDDINDPSATEVTPRHPNVYHISNRPGSYFAFNLPINVKIGLVL